MQTRNVIATGFFAIVLAIGIVFTPTAGFAKSTHQVVGTGSSQAEATGEAHRAAEQICRMGRRTLSEKCTQNGNTWTCILMIECSDD